MLVAFSCLCYVVLGVVCVCVDCDVDGSLVVIVLLTSIYCCNSCFCCLF